MTDAVLTLTELSRIAVVDAADVVLGSTAAECLTYDDTDLRNDLRGFGSGTLRLYLLPEWPGMTDAEVYYLPRTIEALLTYGATHQRTVTL